MNDRYSLEQLIEKFSEHTIESIKIREDQIKKFKEYNPNEPVPDSFMDDFNFPPA